METLDVNGKTYPLLKFLGRGKGGYSYLTQSDGASAVLKHIHHEPCAYYTFGDKLHSELNDYARLEKIGVRMPRLLDVDASAEILLKEFIDGETVFELVKKNAVKEIYFEQMRQMCALLYPAHTNIDYFPTNFVVQNDVLYYVDYECNDYMPEWNFENWGVKYWAQTPEFAEYLRQNP